MAIAVSEVEIAGAMQQAAEREGLLVCPEGGAALAGAAKLRTAGWITERDEVVVFNTGTGLKYAESLQAHPPGRLSAGDRPREKRPA